METYVEIDGWKAGIRFSSAHVIPEYEKCGRLHGHTYAIHARVRGEMDENGVVVDFSIIKNMLREIADELDHKVLIPGEYDKTFMKKEHVELENNGKRFVFPLEDCVFLPLETTSAESLAGYILDRLTEKIHVDNIHEVQIGVDEGPGQGAWVKRSLK